MAANPAVWSRARGVVGVGRVPPAWPISRTIPGSIVVQLKPMLRGGEVRALLNHCLPFPLNLLAPFRLIS